MNKNLSESSKKALKAHAKLNPELNKALHELVEISGVDEIPICYTDPNKMYFERGKQQLGAILKDALK